MRERKKNRLILNRSIALGLLVLVIIFIAGAGYVWYKTQNYRLSKEIAEKERILTSIRFQNKQILNTLAEMRTPRLLDERVRRLSLGLGPVRPDQIVRLYEPIEQAGQEPLYENYSNASNGILKSWQ
jgi:hypothetical protein